MVYKFSSSFQSIPKQVYTFCPFFALIPEQVYGFSVTVGVNRRDFSLKFLKDMILFFICFFACVTVV